MGYHLKGELLEVCDCKTLCPCWIGENPDNGTCDTIVAWHFDQGQVNGINVSGRTIALIAHVPGNILEGNWRAAVDEAAGAHRRGLRSYLAAAGRRALAHRRAPAARRDWRRRRAPHVRGPLGRALHYLLRAVSVTRDSIAISRRRGGRRLLLGRW